MRNGVTLVYGSVPYRSVSRTYLEARQGIARLREEIDGGYVVKAYGTESGQMVVHLVYVPHPVLPGF